MPTEPWLYGFMLAVVVVHLLAVVYVYRTGETSARDRTGDAEGATRGDRAAGGVVCPECDAVNRPGYRFCRDCVTELPGSADAGGSRAAPSGRGIL